eukprot:2873767-Amphidinium_carterae.1
MNFGQPHVFAPDDAEHDALTTYTVSDRCPELFRPEKRPSGFWAGSYGMSLYGDRSIHPDLIPDPDGMPRRMELRDCREVVAKRVQDKLHGYYGEGGAKANSAKQTVRWDSVLGHCIRVGSAGMAKCYLALKGCVVANLSDLTRPNALEMMKEGTTCSLSGARHTEALLQRATREAPKYKL